MGIDILVITLLLTKVSHLFKMPINKGFLLTLAQKKIFTFLTT